MGVRSGRLWPSRDILNIANGLSFAIFRTSGPRPDSGRMNILPRRSRPSHDIANIANERTFTIFRAPESVALIIANGRAVRILHRHPELALFAIPHSGRQAPIRDIQDGSGHGRHPGGNPESVRTAILNILNAPPFIIFRIS